MSEADAASAAAAPAAAAATAAAAPKQAAAAQPKREGGGKKKGGRKAVLKVPKGTRDYDPAAMRIREELFETIRAVYRRHGAVTIETPVFELKETLTSKYGEDSKLIYDLEDQGGELCALRYDLTVPFARYCAQNRVRALKRYHIARVYRRDQPVMNKGRYREFYQCDFDIAGAEFDVMLPDAEVLRTMCEVLDETKVGPYVIKLNHRKLLDGYFAVCGVPEEKFREISSAVDKLDKLPWEDVRQEMVVTKGLAEEAADKIRRFVELKGKPGELLATLREDAELCANAESVKALDELETLFKYCEAYGVVDRISFDLSLARGLDYYTGVIFEAVLLQGGQGVGSIAAGGRYDELIGMFGGTRIPACGFSLGIERCFAILEARYKKSKTLPRPCMTDVMVTAIEKRPEDVITRIKIAAELWDAGIRCETLPKAAPRPQPQLNYANTQGVPLAIVFGSKEIEAGKLLIKNLATGKQDEVDRANIVAEIRTRLEAINEAAQQAQDAADAAAGAGAAAPVSGGKAEDKGAAAAAGGN